MSAIPLCCYMLYLQQCTGVVEDSVQPEYNEEFSFSLAAPDIVGKVLKLSLMDHDSSGALPLLALCNQHHFHPGCLRKIRLQPLRRMLLSQMLTLS